MAPSRPTSSVTVLSRRVISSLKNASAMRKRPELCTQTNRSLWEIQRSAHLSCGASCKTTISDPSSLALGHRTRTAPRAKIAPAIWNATNGPTEDGLVPANVLENMRATVTAGLAKLVEDVKK